MDGADTILPLVAGESADTTRKIISVHAGDFMPAYHVLYTPFLVDKESTVFTNRDSSR